MSAIYVHLPFCPYICPYCDFAKWPHRGSLAHDYFAALVDEIRREPAFAARTLYLGGGTPNTYGCARIADLKALLDAHFGPFSESSIELNPELVAAGDMDAYARAGFDRVSIGVQSFEPREIGTLGRRHTQSEVTRAVSAARQAGVRSVSIDLMFGVPGQTVQSWGRTLKSAVTLAPDHISAYGLTVEEGTPFWQWREKEPGVFPGDGLEADLYELAIDELGAAGYEHYEISNFARPGHRCAHNENYWANGEYRGFGVGAASYRNGVRWVQSRELGSYLQALRDGVQVPAQCEHLQSAAAAGEAVMLALRTADGVAFEAFAQRYGIDFLEFYRPVIRDMQRDGLLAVDGERARLTQRGRLLANDVCGAFVTFA